MFPIASDVYCIIDCANYNVKRFALLNFHTLSCIEWFIQSYTPHMHVVFYFLIVDVADTMASSTNETLLFHILCLLMKFSYINNTITAIEKITRHRLGIEEKLFNYKLNWHVIVFNAQTNCSLE